jgi:hypothetical protein
MRKMSRAEKAELWGSICFVLSIVSVFSLLNQFVDPRIDAIVPSVVPLWVPGLFVGLTILTAYNSWRHGREQTIRGIKKNRGLFF